MKWSRSVVSDSSWPNGLQFTRLSAHGIFQARVLEWVAISFSRGSSWPRDWTRVSHIVGRRFYRLSHQGSPPDANSQLIRKDPDSGKDWRQEKGTTEDKMVGWHHWLDGHEFKQALGDGEGQGSLACCSPWCYRELDTTKGLNNNNLLWKPDVFYITPLNT